MLEYTGLCTVRRVCRTDAADLWRNCFHDQRFEHVQKYLDWCCRQMALDRMVRLVAKTDGQVVGNGQLSFWQGTGEIGSLVVALPFRRRGIGDRLLSALIECAIGRDLTAVELGADLDRAWLQQWYRRRGFRSIGEAVLPSNERVMMLRMSLDVVAE
jgi:ribosomal protein S18 acetylase RimI-like enzyme